jgi:hypothetical protein
VEVNTVVAYFFHNPTGHQLNKHRLNQPDTGFHSRTSPQSPGSFERKELYLGNVRLNRIKDFSSVGFLRAIRSLPYIARVNTISQS